MPRVRSSLLDGLGDWYPLNQLTPEHPAEYDRADALFRERHGACRSHRWSLSGHRATHCGYRYPPPPMSDRQIEQIRRILSSARVRTEVYVLDELPQLCRRRLLAASITWSMTATTAKTIVTCEHAVISPEDLDRLTDPAWPPGKEPRGGPVPERTPPGVPR